MKKTESFQCPNCGTKLPFSFVVKIKNDHEFDCPNCGAALVPEKTKPFLWGYVIGFLAFVVPAQVLLYQYDDIALAFSVSAVCTLVAILFVALYVYSNTNLTKSI